MSALLYWADKKRILNLGKWDSIITITVGLLGIIALIIPIDLSNDPVSKNDCGIVIEKIIVNKELLIPNEKVEVVVIVDNPESYPLVLNWQATSGLMNPGLRTNSLMSIYTSPQSLVDDTISVEISATGCPTVKASKIIKIISPSILPSPIPTTLLTENIQASTETEVSTSILTTPEPTTFTPQLSPTNMSTPEYATVSKEISSALLRHTPGYLGKDKTDGIAEIPSGEVVKIISGPKLVDGLNYWKVSWNGYVGWLAEKSASGKTIMIFNPK